MTDEFDLSWLETQLTDVGDVYSDHGRRAVRGGFYLSEIAAIVMDNRGDAALAIRQDFAEYAQRQAAAIMLQALQVELRGKDDRPVVVEVNKLTPFFARGIGSVAFAGVNHATTFAIADQLVQNATDVRPIHSVIEVVADRIFAQDPIIWLQPVNTVAPT